MTDRIGSPATGLDLHAGRLPNLCQTRTSCPRIARTPAAEITVNLPTSTDRRAERAMDRRRHQRKSEQAAKTRANRARGRTLTRSFYPPPKSMYPLPTRTTNRAARHNAVSGMTSYMEPASLDLPSSGRRPAAPATLHASDQDPTVRPLGSVGGAVRTWCTLRP